MILVATVQRTGTRWLLGALAPEGTKRAVLEMKDVEHARPVDVLVAHLSTRELPAVLAFDGEIWTTRRNVQRVSESWRRLGMDPAELDEQLSNYQTLLDVKRPIVVEIG